MSGETPITIVGNLVDDPSLRFTASGAAVADFTVASTPRKFNKDSGEWEDGDALFLRCSIWRQPAENVAESFTKGSRVVVVGRLKQRSFVDKDENKRTVIEVDAEEVAAATRYATVKILRTERVGASTGGSSRSTSKPADDPWGSAPPSGGSSGYSDEPPF